jgi:hypothetical protein
MDNKIECVFPYVFQLPPQWAGKAYKVPLFSMQAGRMDGDTLLHSHLLLFDPLLLFDWFVPHGCVSLLVFVDDICTNLHWMVPWCTYVHGTCAFQCQFAYVLLWFVSECGDHAILLSEI